MIRRVGDLDPIVIGHPFAIQKASFAKQVGDRQAVFCASTHGSSFLDTLHTGVDTRLYQSRAAACNRLLQGYFQRFRGFHAFG